MTSGDGEAFSALTMMIAVLEQGIDRLGALEPPLDGELIEHAERLRDLCMVELNFGRFSRPPAE